MRIYGEGESLGIHTETNHRETPRMWRAFHRGPPLLAFVVGLLASPCHPGEEPRSPPPGTAPPFELKDLDGKVWSLASIKGNPAILVFGEIIHENTVTALRVIEAILARRSADKAPIPIILISAARGSPDQIRKDLSDRTIKVPFLRDPERRAFAAYRIIVYPTVIIVDPRGTVSSTVVGYPLGFADQVTDGILLASGEMTREAFERARREEREDEGQDLKRRADVLARLADRLGRRGFPEAAAEKFKEALALDGGCVLALIGYGRLLLAERRIVEGEAQFRKALVLEPESVRATLGLAMVEILRGGDELESARQRLSVILQKFRDDPEANFLLGRVYEAQGDPEKAVEAYKRSALQALERIGSVVLP